jgi:hypothetical protein
MATRIRSAKEAQLQLSRELRGAGKTWVEIATAMQSEFGVNARVAFRQAHGWSQGQAADKWNELWPAEPKTFKNFSYWEQWPNKTGYVPSLDVLNHLAELYNCRVSDLLADCADYRKRDPAQQSQDDLRRLPTALAERSVGAESGDNDSALGLAQLINRLDHSSVDELANIASRWARNLDASVDRRALLTKLSFALTVAAALPEIDATVPRPGRPPDMSSANLTGIWRSEYVYYSSGRQQEYTGFHFVVVRHSRRAVTVESLPHTTGSEVTLNLDMEGLFATGTWEERTSPTGYYKGAVYGGAIQLLVSPSLDRMAGKWLGFGKNFQINTGDWTLTLESRSTSAARLREYNLKA